MGIKQTTTGDTLCDQAYPVFLEAMTFPEPVIELAIEPKTKADHDKLGTAIQRLAEEDPTFRVRTTRRPARPLSPVWASCIWRSTSNGSGVSSTLRRTSVVRRSLPRDDPRRVERVELQPQEADRRFGPVRPRRRHLEPLPLGPDAPTFVFENAVTGGRIP